MSATDTERVADLLLGATRPVIIAGNVVHHARAYDEIKRLAELLAMPVATTYGGKSALAETHPCALGTVGKIGQKYANNRVQAADVVLAIGTCLAPENTKYMAPDFIPFGKQKIIHIDIDSRDAGWTYPNEMGVTADAKQALRALTEHFSSTSRPFDVKNRMEELQREKSAAGFFKYPESDTLKSNIEVELCYR
jgi:acetolactate synthase-1/2/3 large subunit